MATPKVGSRKYKGPVHEAVRKSPLGKLTGKQGSKAKAKPKTSLRSSQSAARKATSSPNTADPQARKARMMRAKNLHKKAGTKYDPLSSVSTRKTKAKPKSRKAKVSGKKKGK